MEKIQVHQGLIILQSSKHMAELIPEVRSNLVMAREDAGVIDDVVGIPGRITTVDGNVKAFTMPEWGASSHMARMVLEVMKHDPERRCALNLRYNTVVIEICEKLGLKVSSYNRREEPEEQHKIEGKTVSWGVEQAISSLGEVPDIIYHTGDWGKEPIIALIGHDPVEVASMAVCMAELFHVRKNKK
ncbi:MAG TPA: thiamine-phosphate synthase family protein [Methanobacterium sp.]|jgi:predicted fused transcriptional regulator/phosphomethylpyrimidine kinase|nr:MAG: thiamine-phosphate synthase [Methanobacterium sp.]HOI71318.1 thiamine-phosphate synthase family protein [Methanobacterium sp.]HPX77843.1 thiamine-phosphate synthase family protein [Methanobacterium sp.]